MDVVADVNIKDDLEHYMQAVSRLRAENEQLLAENERLRAALRDTFCALNQQQWSLAASITHVALERKVSASQPEER
jgi:regulator of replication initiation timing